MNNEITGRDDWIIAQALSVAVRALSAQSRPPYSDIGDMEAILSSRYSGYKENFTFQNDLKRALLLGFEWEKEGSLNPAKLKKWLSEHAPGDNVVELFTQ